MQQKTIYTLAIISSLLFSTSCVQANKDKETEEPTAFSNQKIQAAILLDVSNSMDGLIDQAKAQLWNMVSTMGKAKCNGATPKIEIALYEYGRTTNNEKAGFVKQLMPFTTDLDSLSQILFSLKTDGGDEYCGQVIYTSLNNLAWDNTPGNYKVIFIAGNEDFLQGNLHYTKACALAKQKGVIVNTIYCGDRMQGISEHWNINSECGGGSFTNINQDEKIEEIPTPYDDQIITLNEKLNSTYIAYGSYGFSKSASQKQVDAKNQSVNKSVEVKRIAVKGNKSLYKNESWDMVDKFADDKEIVSKIDKATLADSLRNKSDAELQKIIVGKKKEREDIQNQITSLNTSRDKFIATEKSKVKNQNNKTTLETEIEKIIRKQAKQFNMVIE
jgi:hypothetical protein